MYTRKPQYVICDSCFEKINNTINWFSFESIDYKIEIFLKKAHLN
jgi:hypothetical protein